MTYFPPTLRLSQLSVMKEGGNPFFEVETASAPLDLKSLLHLKFVPSLIQFTHWKLFISRQKDGHWDLEDWLSAALFRGGGSPVLYVELDGRRNPLG